MLCSNTYGDILGKKSNMANYPRFMIADNPMADPEGEYVYHSQQPRFLAKRVYDDPTTDFKIVDDIDNMLQFFKADAGKIAKLMSRLGDWYNSYLKWEDEQDSE